MDQEQSKQLDELRELLKQMKSGYRKIKTNAEAQVIRDEYASGPHVSLVPFEQERSQQVKGKPVAKPKTAKNCYVYGIDAHNRIIIVRRLGPDGQPEAEVFLECREPSHWLSRTYLDGGKRIGKVMRMNYEKDGTLTTSVLVGREGDFVAEKYSYDKGKLSSMEVERHMSGTEGTFQDKYQFTYDDLGGGEAVFIRSDGRHRPGFKFPKPHSPSWKNEWPG